MSSTRTPLDRHRARWLHCTQCRLCQSRKHTALYRWLNGYHARRAEAWMNSADLKVLSVYCDILVIGEAPGESENLLGEPFVGEAGHKLDEIFTEALEFIPQKKQPVVLISNIIACWPRDEEGKTRLPSDAERDACQPRLVDFIQLARPQMIITAGQYAKKNVPFGFNSAKVRRKFPFIKHWLDIPHPSYICRMESTSPSKAPTEQAKCVLGIRHAVSQAFHFPLPAWTP